jgi:imidazolonepropionase-like amidohydrolase
MLLLKNLKIITAAEQTYENADVLIDGGKFMEIGENLKAPGAEVIDLTGCTAIPGIIDAHCHIGVYEDSMGFEGADGNEMTDPVTPHLRAIDAINPEDRCFEEARMHGVTTVVTGPGSANVIGGQFAALKTYGQRVEDMVIKAPAALKAAFGENPKRVYHDQKKSPMTRMATAAIFRESFIKAAEYAKNKTGEKPPDIDIKKEALLQALNGEVIVKAHAHRADDILTAIRLAKEFNLKLSLDHCTDGYRIPEFIKESGAKVIIGPLFSERCKIELKNLSFEAPRILYENGIEFAIMTDHPVIPVQHLPVCAAIAVREGLPEIEAIKAITINAARACCLEDRIGSIERGKDADIAVYAGDPLDVRSRVRLVLIDGRIVHSAKIL